ncbi:MAG: hypothetical protein AAGI28_02330 [Pseudomonadota bacterium]
MSTLRALIVATILCGSPSLLSQAAAHELTTETLASGIKLQNDMCGEKDAFFRIDTTLGQSRTIRLQPGRTLYITVAKGDKMIIGCGAPPDNAPTEYIKIDHNHGEY